MIVLQLKANDEKLKQKQIRLNYEQHGKVENVHGQQKSINEGLIDNIERKLSLLAQIWSLYFSSIICMIKIQNKIIFS